MDPELQKHRDDVNALIGKVHPHFQGVHFFVMMMTLADLIAKWVLSHPEARQSHAIATLIQTTQDRIVQLIEKAEEETRH